MLTSGLLAAGGLFVAGCERERPVIESEDYVDSASSMRNRLRDILDRQAQAVLDRDEEAYLADLDQSNQQLIEQEKRVFANVRQFDFADFRHILDQTSEEKQDDGTTVFRPVIRVIKLTADEGPGDVAPAEMFLYRVREQDDKLVVTEIVGATEDNHESLNLTEPFAEAPWYTDRLRVVNVNGKVWLVGDETVDDLDDYAAVAERELAVVEDLWGDRTKFPGHVLFFTRDRSNFHDWFGVGRTETFDPDVLGLQIPLLGVRKDGILYRDQFVASRIVVNLASIEAKNTEPRITIRHELTHAVTARAELTVGFTRPPIWAIEGFARYSETVGNPERANWILAIVADGVRAGKFTGEPPASKGFYEDSGFNYCLGASVFILAERLKGRDAAVELYASIIKRPDPLDVSFFDLPIFDGIARRVLGMSGDAFQSRWASFVRSGA